MRRMSYDTPLGQGRSSFFRLRLALEFVAIFIGGPLAVLAIHRGGVLFLALWLGALVAFFSTRSRPPFPRHLVWPEVRSIAVRFSVLAPLVAVATWLAFPHLFLEL